MKLDNIVTLLFCGTSIAAGAFLGVLRSKLFSTKTENKFHYAFYICGSITLFGTALAIIFNTSEIFNPPNWFAIIALTLAVGFSIALIIFTKKHLVIKTIYKIKELDPIVNKFTSNSDKNEIKLFGGDLDFLGKSPSEINGNIQYTHLKSLGFKKISILCEEPKDITTKIRYGLLYHDNPNIELRFYQPDKADLKVRGRIKKLNNTIKLLLYTKAETVGSYKILETDTANANGALYENIWQLVWSIATRPSSDQIKLYIAKFKDE